MTPEPHEILKTAIEDKFEELYQKMTTYDDVDSFDNWQKCIDILPEIADLVTCLKLEALKLEGRHPVN